MTTFASIDWLFETNALRVSPADSPFWYTSGFIGPYYINTHFLCGGETEALEILSLIDTAADIRPTFPDKIIAALEKVEQSHAIFRATLDALEELSRQHISVEGVDMISGGQRRDWFFAPLLARRLEKPCIYLYNDLSAVDAVV